MPLAFRDHGILGQIAVVIQQQMQLHRSFGPTKACPIKQARAQIDYRGIHAEQLVLETKLPRVARPAGRHGLTLRQQLIEHRFVQPPRPMFIGVRQSGTVGCRGYPKMAQFSFRGGQASANLAQRLGVT